MGSIPTGRAIYMQQYLILTEHKEDVIQWCSENMEMRRDYNWFPFYTTSAGEDAIRLDIFNDDDAIIFTLIWKHFINDQN